jgi:sugar phosphate isomerase/epimerase
MNLSELTRRHFVKGSALTGFFMAGSPVLASNSTVLAEPPRKSYINLSCGRIGVKVSFPESVDLATRFGFEAVDPDPSYFAKLSDSELKALLTRLQVKKLRLSAAGLPVDFRKDQATFEAGLKGLLEYCKTLQRAGVDRIGTWILSFSDTLTYLENFRVHTARLKACAEILKDHNQRLGLEYVAPKTSWRSSKHPFIHCMSEAKELIAAIGTGNVGLQLDSWHWFNAEENESDVLSLQNKDVVLVDLNDAPQGVPLDQQKDLVRELPLATGVIPVKAFLDGLRKIGYDGPIHAEPFNAALRAMPIDKAVEAVAEAMKRALEL